MSQSGDRINVGPASGEETTPIKTVPAWVRPVALLAVVAAIIVLAALFDVGRLLGSLRDWIASLGVWGPVVYVGVYIVATVAALPGSAMSLIAGALFGSVWGTVCVSIGSTVGASLAFLIGRYIARDAVSRWLSGKDKFVKLDPMTEQYGAVIVALTRLVPLFPFNLLNYGLGLTKVRFWTYVFWSWLCMLPFTVVYVVGVDAIVEGVRRGEVPWVLVGIVAGMIVLLALLIRHARARLKAGEAGGGQDG